MARIQGVDLPKDKRIEIGLTYIFGIGQTTSNKILKEAKINPNKRVKELNAQEVEQLKSIIDSIKVEGALHSAIVANIKRLRDVGCYRGIRHTRHLPVRGQRTKTNSRTVRGNVRRTMASGHKEATKKG
ncbi:MAG: 30S ribosomal protein S13 [Patescibacteria group bacterium]|nr:30S ribosomal protein S13 [Patescibacteria group bacterium]MDD5164035.1 30S ribosomal protein S13 [Patescibacteria group bacterium]MDD5534881.1 30S ribosomal protein S13 [Patescibacteria group bacterium]